MTKKTRQRRAQQPRPNTLISSQSWRLAGIRIATTIFLLSIILYVAFAERIPIIGASCNEPEPSSITNIRHAIKRNPILTSADSTRAVVMFRNTIQGLIDTEGIAKNSKTSICIIILAQQEVLFEKNPHQYLTPASTTKLFSTFAALYTMGTDYMIPTQILSEGTIENGVLRGDVFLKGFGDALLDEQDITALALQLKQKGITSISGGIYADASYFDNITARHIYSGDNEIVEPLAPITALGIHRNTCTVDMVNGQIQILPQSDIVTVNKAINPNSLKQKKSPQKKGIISSLSKQKKSLIPAKSTKKKAVKESLTTGKKAGKNVSKNKVLSKKSAKTTIKKNTKQVKHAWWKAGSEYLELQRVGDAPKAPKGKKKKYRAPRVQISMKHNPNGLITVKVVGKGTSSASFTMKQPDMYTAGVLSYKLRLAGITVGKGIIGRKTASTSAKIIAEFKRPLLYMISMVNKNSDNFLAEHVYKMVGAYAGGQINTGKVATETVKNALSQCGIPIDGLCINDGSGLCRKNLFSAYVQTMLLDKASKMKFSEAFKQTLSIAGVDGTLKNRMIGTYAQKNVCAKTGTLRNTSALSGYVTSRDGDHIVFSIINNGPSVGNYKQLENRIAEAIANFSYLNTIGKETQQ